ncbi:hypothetical protein [Actinomadura atramentaria]|uniref:hypothetical protein n=1 Tax=Actinomadura atramentaria TaxID=1990 RepID=UPI0003799885|nr:hypothetical protein [Actinomadura atramentaria]
MDAARWTGPRGVAVAQVRLTGAHRVWASFAGVPADARDALLATAGGALLGRGYYASAADLSADLSGVVDLSELSPG